MVIVYTCLRFHKKSGYTIISTLNNYFIYFKLVECGIEWMDEDCSTVPVCISNCILSGQSVPVQTNPAYVDPRDITNTIISSEIRFNHKVLLSKNPAYQDIHSIQTNTSVYDTVRQTTAPVYLQ